MSAPYCGSSPITICAIPIATPACGRSVSPRYFLIFVSAFAIVAPRRAPKYFPRARAKRYTTPKQLAKNGYNQIKVRVYQEQSKADKVAMLKKLMQQRQKRKELNK